MDQLSEQNTNTQSQEFEASHSISVKDEKKTKTDQWLNSKLASQCEPKPQVSMTDRQLVKYVYHEFSKDKCLEDQVQEVVDMVAEIRIKETVRGSRIHQYWSNEQLSFLQDKF